MAGERRARGEGGIRNRADGAWEASLDLGTGPGGRRQVRWFRASTRSAALKRRRDAQDQLARGELVLSSPRMTVAQWMENWLEGPLRTSVELGERKPLTAQNYRHVYQAYVKDLVGGVRLDKVRAQDVDRMTQILRQLKFKPNTVRLARSVLRAALTAAQKEGLVARNAVSLSTAPKVSTRERRKNPPALNLAQARTLFASLGGDADGPLFTVAVLTGLRRGELLALHWSDVDLEGRVVHVTSTLGRVNGEGLVRTEPKTTASYADVPLVRDAVSAFRRQREAQEAAKKKLGDRWEGDGTVFHGPRGGPMDPPRATRAWNSVRDGLGFPKEVTFHGLRHSTASVLFELGVPMEVISHILRHTSIRETADVYVEVPLEAQAKALARVQRALDKG